MKAIFVVIGQLCFVLMSYVGVRVRVEIEIHCLYFILMGFCSDQPKPYLVLVTLSCSCLCNVKFFYSVCNLSFKYCFFADMLSSLCKLTNLFMCL